MSLRVWLRALRPLAHANVAPPILLGQALAAHAGTALDPSLFVLAHAFGLVDHAFIVLANDHADRALDADNDTYSPFSGGSRVLPDGLLTPDAIRRAALIAAGMLVALSLGVASVLARPLAPLFAVAAITLLWAYSYRPLALSYRGGGELLQGLGLGAVLPLWGFYVQRGTLDGFPWLVLAPLVLLNVAGNVLTALPDTPSDRRGGKHTWPVRVGEGAARWHAWVVLALALAVLGWIEAREHGAPIALGLAAAPALGLLASLAWIARADAIERAACTRFVLAAASAIGTAQLGWVVVLFALAVGSAGCRCGVGDAPAASTVSQAPALPLPEVTMPPEIAPPPTTAAPEPTPIEVGDTSTPTARWQIVLAFDAAGRDLSIASFALQPEPELARASSFSLRFCHGDDPVGTVLSLGLSANIDRHPAETRAALRCGRVVATHTPESARIHVVELDRETRAGHVLAIATTLASLEPLAAALPRAHAETLGAISLLCLPFDPGSCADRDDSLDHALAIVEGHLVAGAYPQLARILAWDARSRLVTLLRELTARFTAQPDVEVDFLAPGGAWTIGPRRWLPLTVGDAADALAETVRERGRAVAWEHGMRGGVIIVAPRCSEPSACPDADPIETELAGYHRSWRRTARHRLDELFEGAADLECERDAETARMIAISSARVTREQTLSILAYRVEAPSDPRCADTQRLALESAAARVHDVLGDL